MNGLEQLIENNRKWVAGISSEEPDFFSTLAKQQTPKYLWIGCSDSRVPANQIIGLRPGEIFVHRNIANIVVHTDLNCLSVLQFAVDVLKVEHVIVTGHYGCGGVAAAYDGLRLGLIDNWLRHVQDIREMHREIVDATPNDHAARARLCELNVLEQVRNVAQTTIVQDAWHRDQPLRIHGLIYGIEDGLLRDLGMTVANNDELHARYASVLQEYKRE